MHEAFNQRLSPTSLTEGTRVICGVRVGTGYTLGCARPHSLDISDEPDVNEAGLSPKV